MIEEGAAIIDIGGESTRPGAQAGRRRGRTAPRRARDRSARGTRRAFRSRSTPASRRSCGGRRAGAGLINDVRALREPGALEAAAGSRLRRVPDAHAGRAAHHAGRPALWRCRDGGRGIPAASARRPAARPASRRTGIVDRSRVSASARRLAHNLALLRGLPRWLRWASRCWSGCRASRCSAALLGTRRRRARAR